MMSTLTEFRQEKDEFFKTSRQSPLTPEQKQAFNGLQYFPENPALRLELALERFPQPTAVVLATSTGDEREYEQVGQIRFRVDEEEAVLQVYEADYGFFLPFADATAPDESYGAGRYLEPEALGGDRLAVDFNLAYNPYCAYNERWSCPLPPAANRLKVRITAGEKKFHD
jgi:uncharacterized protein (DUF1684 family)